MNPAYRLHRCHEASRLMRAALPCAFRSGALRNSDAKPQFGFDRDGIEHPHA